MKIKFYDILTGHVNDSHFTDPDKLGYFKDDMVYDSTIIYFIEE